MITPSQLKELFRAVGRQSMARARAYVAYEYPYDVLDVNLRALTLRDLATLQAVGCGFFCDVEKITEIDALKLLWFLSENYKPSTSAQLSFARKIAKKYSSAEVIQGAREFIDEMFLDCGTWVDSDFSNSTLEQKKKPKPPHYCTTSIYVARLARAFHWSEKEILNMPLPRVFQYYHLAGLQDNPDYSWTQFSEHLELVFKRANRKIQR